jgi:hypothetical protein
MNSPLERAANVFNPTSMPTSSSDGGRDKAATSQAMQTNHLPACRRRVAVLGVPSTGRWTFDVAYLGNKEVPAFERDAITPLLECEAVVLAFALHAGEPRRLTGPDPAEECRERQVNTQGGVLQKVAVNVREFRELLAPPGKVLLLRVLADAIARCFIQELALVEQAVVGEAQGVQCRVQRRGLRLRWKNAVLIAQDCFDVIAVHIDIIPGTTSKHNRRTHFVRAKASVS